MNPLARPCALLLVAAAPLASPAQSTVTISGLYDVGLWRDTADTWRLGPIQRSNIAFSGVEPLAGDTAVTFALSHRFDSGTGENESPGKPFFHGEATLGFKGPFGALKLGRRLDAIYDNDWNFDPWANFDRIASPAWDMWHDAYASDPHGDSGTPEYGRLDHGVFYDSPAFGGVSVHVSGSPQKVAGDSNLPLAGALLFNGDHVVAMASHARNSAGATDSFFGLKGTFADLQLMGVFDDSRAAGVRAKATTLGATWHVGRIAWKLGWGRLVVDDLRAERMVGAGAAWSLSARTSLYVDLARKALPDRTVDTFGAGFAHAF